MNLPLADLVLATTVAWVVVFLGALPARLIREEFFRRQVVCCSVAWFAVAALDPVAIVHYHVLLGLICAAAWWKFRHGDGLKGKLWLFLAAGFGVSAGVVLILAVTPQDYPSNFPAWRALPSLVSIYLRGAVLGLALTLYLFTRREATRAEIPLALVRRLGSALLPLVLVRGAVLVVTLVFAGRPVPIDQAMLLLALSFTILPVLAWAVKTKAVSPTPSATGPVVLIFGAAALGTEYLAHHLAP